MTNRLEFGIVGTFDVENYGDLLFPLIARNELGRRLPDANVVAYSYNQRTAPQWPYEVRQIATLCDGDANLAGLLIGGGQLIRTDSYFPIPVPAETVSPYDIWLLPALAALALRVPLVWNAIGAWQGGVAFMPAVLEMLAVALRGSDCVAVRDAITAELLDAIAGVPVSVKVPDTGFGLLRLIDRERPSAEFAEWRRELGLAGPYVVIQATQHLALSRDALLKLRAALPGVELILLPICKVHGDRCSLEAFSGLGAIADGGWRSPDLFAEIIAHSMLAVGSSLHFGISAIAFGVPLLRAQGYNDLKYQMLDEFAGAQWLNVEVTRDGIKQLAAQAKADPRVADYARQLDRYWDGVAEIFRPSPASKAPSIDQRAFAAWTLRAARRQVLSYESVAVRFRNS